MIIKLYHFNKVASCSLPIIYHILITSSPTIQKNVPKVYILPNEPTQRTERKIQHTRAIIHYIPIRRRRTPGHDKLAARRKKNRTAAARLYISREKRVMGREPALPVGVVSAGMSRGDREVWRQYSSLSLPPSPVVTYADYHARGPSSRRYLSYRYLPPSLSRNIDMRRMSGAPPRRYCSYTTLLLYLSFPPLYSARYLRSLGRCIMERERKKRRVCVYMGIPKISGRRAVEMKYRGEDRGWRRSLGLGRVLILFFGVCRN